ncbi:hypothetical protein BpHYR1_011622 [Brachionus plicatilis]|uniref:Uncharacterized protein n=1 Tax=Brachionus plicatilis TaxID=10195 RepID=A0A3M7S3S2_BRAPC|nr:hypothetical protein BpHYR1_011622 [Brachionus plicatilis]
MDIVYMEIKYGNKIRMKKSYLIFLHFVLVSCTELHKTRGRPSKCKANKWSTPKGQVGSKY